jgi:hypothetical protein
VDPDEKSVVAQFWSKLRKDKDADSSLLSKISEFALSKAKSLWLDAYSDSIFDPLLTFCAQLYSVPKSSFKQFTTSFPLDQLPKPPSRPAYQPPPLTSELRQRDNSAKSLVSDALAPLCIFQMRFLQCSPCELQAVALEKTAIQLSTHIPILGFTIEEEDKVKLAKRVFLPAVQFDGDMNLFVGAVWKQFMKLPGASYFVARIVLVPGTKRRYLQPGHLFFERSTSLLKVQWYECEKHDYVFAAWLQMEFIPDIKQLPSYDDAYLSQGHSPFIFSNSLWSNGTMRMLNPKTFSSIFKENL